MKNIIIMLSVVLLTTAASHASTYVYCGRTDGSDWDWLLDEHENYEIIRGRWGRITEVNGMYFNVFRVDETTFTSRSFNCPAGYVPQPAESGTSRWEIFEIIKPDGSSYFIDGYKTYYSLISRQATRNDSFRL